MLVMPCKQLVLATQQYIFHSIPGVYDIYVKCVTELIFEKGNLLLVFAWHAGTWITETAELQGFRELPFRGT